MNQSSYVIYSIIIVLVGTLIMHGSGGSGRSWSSGSGYYGSGGSWSSAGSFHK